MLKRISEALSPAFEASASGEGGAAITYKLFVKGSPLAGLHVPK